MNITPGNSDDNGNAKNNMVFALSAVLFSRLVLNTARRFAYPFAPVLSRGLGVPLSAMTALIAVNQATGVLALMVGPWTDRLGYRRMMMISLGMLTVGMAAVGIIPLYAAVLAALFLAGMAKNVYDAAVQAYVGERVPYARRGAAIGLIELSWAGSTLIGIPVMGLVIDAVGWQGPFFVLAITGLASMAATRWLLPADRPKAAGAAPESIRAILLQLLRKRHTCGALGFAFFISAASDNLFVVYGAWLEASFHVGVVALGFSTTVIGVAEFFGEIGTAALSDRIGLTRAILIGAALSAIGYGILPFTEASLWAALGGLAVVFLFFEFTIVSALTLCTELLPAARATMMAGFLATAGIGRFAGALLGGVVWTHGGILWTASVSIGMTLFAMIALAWGLRGWAGGSR